MRKEMILRDGDDRIVFLAQSQGPGVWLITHEGGRRFWAYRTPWGHWWTMDGDGRKWVTSPEKMTTRRQAVVATYNRMKAYKGWT